MLNEIVPPFSESVAVSPLAHVFRQFVSLLIQLRAISADCASSRASSLLPESVTVRSCTRTAVMAVKPITLTSSAIASTSTYAEPCCRRRLMVRSSES